MFAEQPPQNPEPRQPEKTAATFKNPIKGLEGLDLLKPVTQSAEKRGTLSAKVRGSIERKVVSRQRKILAMLDELAAAATAAKLQEDFVRFENIGKLLAEQADIVEKESLGNIDPAPFREKLAAVENLERNLVARFGTGGVTDVKTEIEKFRQILAPAAKPPGEEPPAAEDSRERMANELIAAGLKDPDIQQKIARELPEAARVKYEHLSRTRPLGEERPRITNEDLSKEVPVPGIQQEETSEKAMTWEDVVSLLETSPTVDRRVGDKVVAVDGKKMAVDVRKLVAEFQNLSFLRKPPAERRELILAALEKLTTNERLKRDLQKALELKGWLVRREEKPEAAAKKGKKNGMPRISAAAAGDEDALTIARHLSRARARRAREGGAPVSAAPAGAASAPAPASLPRGISNEELAELGLATTPEKYKEEAAAAPISGAAAVALREAAGLPRARAERPPLYERGDAGRASMDNPRFLEFLEEVRERGVWTSLGKENQEQMLEQAFEVRGAVARGILGVYESQVLRDLGNRFVGAEMGKVISAHIEKLSLEYPEKVAGYKTLLDSAVELSRQEAELVEKRNKIVSVEEYQQAAARFDEKKKIVETAKATVLFWPGFKKLWQGEGMGTLTWRKDLKEARAKAKELGLGLGKTHFVWSQKSISFMDQKLTDDYLQGNSEIYSRKQADLAQVERELVEKQEQLAKVKDSLFAAVGVHEEVAEVVRRGISQTMNALANPALGEEALEGYERGEEIVAQLERLAASGEKGAEFMDYARKFNQKDFKRDIELGAELFAARAIRALFARTLENPYAPNRLSALKAALAGWRSKEHIGKHRGKKGVATFVGDVRRRYWNELADGLDAIREQMKVGLETDEDLTRRANDIFQKLIVLEAFRAGRAT